MHRQTTPSSQAAWARGALDIAWKEGARSDRSELFVPPLSEAVAASLRRGVAARVVVRSIVGYKLIDALHVFNEDEASRLQGPVRCAFGDVVDKDVREGGEVRGVLAHELFDETS